MIQNRESRWRFPKAILPLLFVPMILAGCGTFRKLGLISAPDIDQRRGVTGTEESPLPLNPLTKYKLVMAAGECRWFQVRVPKRWYWKVTLTAVCPDKRSGRLEASLDISDGGWKPVVPYETRKVFDLAGWSEMGVRVGDSRQGVVAAANIGPERPLVLKICQSGAPVQALLEFQVSAFGDVLLAPPLKKSLKHPGE